MINILVKKEENRIQQITVSGHAYYDELGKDIVCSAVTAIIIGGINAIDQANLIECCEYEVEAGFVDLKILNDLNKTLQVILETLYVQFKSIEETYAKYITIQEV